MKSRKQRRLEARQSGGQFVPQYNGNSPVSYNEAYGVGSERFNNKFVDFTIDYDVIAPVVVDSSEVSLEASDSIGNIIKNDSVEIKETGLLSRIKNSFKKGRR